MVGNVSCPGMGRGTVTHVKVATQELVGQMRMMEALSSSLPPCSSCSSSSRAASLVPLSTQSWCRARRSSAQGGAPSAERRGRPAAGGGLVGFPVGRALCPSCPWHRHWCIEHQGGGVWGGCQGVPAVVAGAGKGKGSWALGLLLQLGDDQLLWEQEKASLTPLAAPSQPHIHAQQRLGIAESLPAEQSRAESLPAEQSRAVGMRKAAGAAGLGRSCVSGARGEPTWSHSSSWPGPSHPGQEGPRWAPRTCPSWRHGGWDAVCWWRCLGSAARPEPASS